MSMIQEFRATEQAIQELQARLAQMQQDGSLQREMEFEEKLRALMGEYSKSLKDVNSLLDPESKLSKLSTKAGSSAGSSKTRAVRKIKQYKNPHNGEVIETKGGNHKTLKEWKSKWGNDAVEGWMTLLD